jgi:hypothetical protein
MHRRIGLAERPRSGAHGEGFTERGLRKTEPTLTNGPAGRVASVSPGDAPINERIAP